MAHNSTDSFNIKQIMAGLINSGMTCHTSVNAESKFAERAKGVAVLSAGTHVSVKARMMRIH